MAPRQMPSAKGAPAQVIPGTVTKGPSKKPAAKGGKFPGKSTNMGAKIKRTSDMPKPANA